MEFSDEKLSRSLSAYAQAEDKLNKISRITADFVNDPLEKLAKSIGRISDRALDTSDILNKFAEGMLKSLTKTFVNAALEKPEISDRSSDVGDLSKALFFGNQIQPSYSPAIDSNSVNITVLNNTSTMAQVNERVNSRGQKEIEIMIDNMVASSLSQGTQTRSVLKSLFGIDNLLRSR